jgi:hypothetical protein
MENHLSRRVIQNQIISQNERNAVMRENVNPVYPTYFGLNKGSDIDSDFNKMPPANQQYGHGSDIEIIDLDDPRRDVKPTTWHRK